MNNLHSLKHWVQVHLLRVPLGVQQGKYMSRISALFDSNTTQHATDIH